MSLNEFVQKCKRPQRWLRFRLRTVLIIFTVFCVWFGWMVESVRKQRIAANRVRAIGGSVLYEYQLDRNTDVYFKRPQRYQVTPYGPGWLRELLGTEFFNSAASINLGLTGVTDEDLKVLQEMPKLRSIGLEQTMVSDAGLKHLSGLKHLRRLYVHDTNVTDAGIEWLRCEFPAIEIHHTTSEDSTPTIGNIAFTFQRQLESTRLGVQVNPNLVVQLVHRGSPAALAGITADDTIVGIDNTPVLQDQAFVDLVDSQELASSLEVQLLRSGQTLAVQVILDGDRP